MGATLGLTIAGAFAGYLAGAWLTDALGRRRTLMIGAFVGPIVVLPGLLLDARPLIFRLPCFPHGVVSIIHFSALGPLLSEQFPTEVRATGHAFAYNIGRGIGAVFPAAAGLLAHRIGLMAAVGGFTTVAYAVLAVGALLIKEGPVRELDEVSAMEANR